jgi:hypothetical protein
VIKLERLSRWALVKYILVQKLSLDSLTQPSLRTTELEGGNWRVIQYFPHQINFPQFPKYLKYLMPLAIQNHPLTDPLEKKNWNISKQKREKMINHRKIWGKWRVTSKNNLWISLTILELFIARNCFLKHYVVLFSSWYIFPLFFLCLETMRLMLRLRDQIFHFKEKLRVEFYYFAFIRFIRSQSKMKRQKKWCNIKKKSRA